MVETQEIVKCGAGNGSVCMMMQADGVVRISGVDAYGSGFSLHLVSGTVVKHAARLAGGLAAYHDVRYRFGGGMSSDIMAAFYAGYALVTIGHEDLTPTKSKQKAYLTQLQDAFSAAYGAKLEVV